MVLLFLILSNTCSSNAANSYPTLVKDPTFWRNNEIPPHLSFKFNDGSQLRLLLANANDNPDFGFGFFTKGNNTNAFYLVVVKFMTFYDVPPIVVWSANRDEPVGEFATLELRDGDVVLRNEDGYIIWSTETPGSIARRLHVIDGGDLRLVDNRHTLIWNSFNHPTDVWIPGQVLGLKHVLTSSISNSNFSSGIFHLGVTIDSIRAYVDSDPLQIYRTIFPFHESNEFYNFSIGFLNYTSGSVKYQSSGGDFQYIRLEPNGHLNVYQLVDGYNQTLISNVLEDKQYGDCSYPEVCGTYGICSDGQCSCPESSGSYFRPSNSSLGSFECAQVAPLSCQDTGFVDLNNVTYFSFVPQLLFTNPENCKRECLKNCSCKAALFSLKNKVEENELASLVDESNEDMQCHKEDAVKVMEIAILCLQTNLYKRPTAAKVVRFLEGLTNVEPISDYKFLTMIHIDEEPVATPADACYISPITASVLSGPR
ncbi:hypothetical protein COLO4_17504 [Corchorus olitorius]|uniref:Bulb-type lectin domain-containing protein n=1 Tax=Corchorus olitorius TaxID=93759 RepID=A0A1R3JCH0_9ROSI|nr:hypothetical protein COLO4_17504 [Corchorus olitorius]